MITMILMKINIYKVYRNNNTWKMLTSNLQKYEITQSFRFEKRTNQTKFGKLCGGDGGGGGKGKIHCFVFYYCYLFDATMQYKIESNRLIDRCWINFIQFTNLIYIKIVNPFKAIHFNYQYKSLLWCKQK